MTEATVQQSAATTREQIWLNREQVRKEKPVYRTLKRAQDIFFSLLALIVLSPLLLIVALAIVIDDPKGSPIFTQVRSGIDGIRQWRGEFAGGSPVKAAVLAQNFPQQIASVPAALPFRGNFQRFKTIGTGNGMADAAFLFI